MKITLTSLSLLATCVLFAPAAEQLSSKPTAPVVPEAGSPGVGKRSGSHDLLSPAERTQLLAVHKKVANDPSLIEARKRVTDALQSLRETERDVLLKAYPNIRPILDKMAPPASFRPIATNPAAQPAK